MPSVRASAPSTLSVKRPAARSPVSWPSSIRKQPSRLVPTTVPASASTSRLYQSRWMYRPRSTPAMSSASLAGPGVMTRLAASGAGEDSRAMCACPVEAPPVAPALARSLTAAPTRPSAISSTRRLGVPSWSNGNGRPTAARRRRRW